MKKIIVVGGIIALAAIGAKKIFGGREEEPIAYFPPADEDQRLAA